MRKYIVAVLAVVTGLVGAQDFNTVTECARPCFGEMQQKFGALGCTGEGDMLCLCGKSDFRAGLKSCSEARCRDLPGGPDTLLSYASAVCASAGAPPPDTQSPPPPPSSASPVPGTVSNPPPAPIITSPGVPSSVTTGPSPETTSANVFTSQSASHGDSHATSSSFSSSASPSPTAVAGATSNAPDTTEKLSQATKVGIGIGSAAAAVGLVGVAICVILHKRGGRRDAGAPPLNISQPMPGSGRLFASDHHREKDGVGMSDLEFKSRRYEDMLPRQSPRTMV